MKKIIGIIFLVTLLAGCAHLPCNAWQKMEFDIPSNHSEEEFSSAKDECLKRVDRDNPARCYVSGLVGLKIYSIVEKEYQDCMADKGFTYREVERIAIDPASSDKVKR